MQIETRPTKPDAIPQGKSSVQIDHSRLIRRIIVALIISIYAVALFSWYDTVPRSLCNDTAREALLGEELLDARRLPPIAFGRLGNGSETGWILLDGISLKIFGHTTFAATLPSRLSALGTIVMIGLIAHKLRDDLDPIVCLLVAASMLWMLHFGRTGFRAVGGMFLFVVALDGLVDLLRDPKRIWPAARIGIALALGIWTYTTIRCAILALTTIGLFQIILSKRRNDGLTRTWINRFLLIGIIGLVICLPHIKLALTDPSTYFGRGTYAVRGDLPLWIHHILASAIQPVYTPPEYRIEVSFSHVFDAVAGALALIDLRPMPLVVGIAALFGIVSVFSRRIKVEPPTRTVLCYLVITIVFTIVLIGFLGPSQTRLLILAPAYALLAGFSLTWISKRMPAARFIVPIGLIALIAVGWIRYFDRMLTDKANVRFAPDAREISGLVRTLALEGHTSLVLLRLDPDVVEFYAHDQLAKITVEERLEGSFDSISPAQFHAADFVVVSMIKPDAVLLSELSKRRDQLPVESNRWMVFGPER